MKLILQMMPQPRRTKSLSSTVLQTFVAISSGKKRTILFRWLFLGTLNFSKETYFLLVFTFARWKASLSRRSIIVNIEREEVNHNSRFRIQTQRSLTATVIFRRSVKNVMQYYSHGFWDKTCLCQLSTYGTSKESTYYTGFSHQKASKRKWKSNLR